MVGDWVSRKQAALELGESVTTIDRRIKAGTLVASKMGQHGSVKVSMSSIERLLEFGQNVSRQSLSKSTTTTV